MYSVVIPSDIYRPFLCYVKYERAGKLISAGLKSYHGHFLFSLKAIFVFNALLLFWLRIYLKALSDDTTRIWPSPQPLYGFQSSSVADLNCKSALCFSPTPNRPTKSGILSAGNRCLMGSLDHNVSASRSEWLQATLSVGDVGCGVGFLWSSGGGRLLQFPFGTHLKLAGIVNHFSMSYLTIAKCINFIWQFSPSLIEVH